MAKAAELGNQYYKDLKLPLNLPPRCKHRRACQCWARVWSHNHKVAYVLAGRLDDLHPDDNVTLDIAREFYKDLGRSHFAQQHRKPLNRHKEVLSG